MTSRTCRWTEKSHEDDHCHLLRGGEGRLFSVLVLDGLDLREKRALKNPSIGDSRVGDDLP